jgi:CBS domain-containing protein
MDPLTLPVGTLAQSIELLYAEDSLNRAVAIVREAPGRVAPVIGNGRYIGVVTERTLLRLLGEGADRSIAAAEAVEPGQTIMASATGAEAMRSLDESGASVLVVLNPDQEPVGIIGASDLFPRPIYRPVPPNVGGMATPFGVYLTCGSVNGGAPWWALVVTGAMLSLMYLGAEVLFGFLLPYIPRSPFFNTVSSWIPLTLFLLAMRALPLAGTHAAEHMVVHALERGEPLDPRVVKRMPRVHKRCGTNLAVGIMIFAGLLTVDLGLGPDMVDLQRVFAVIIALATFRRVGGAVQYLVTTKPPSDKQIQSGIKAADELLANYGKSRRNRTPFWMYMLNMGFLQVMTGALAMVFIAHYLAGLLQLPVSW